MFTTLFQKLTLGAAGLTALCIGLAITFAPHGFYAGFDIKFDTDPTFLSELRAPGANLAALGIVIFLGALRPRMASFSAAIGSVLFLAFAFGRLVGITLDGWPQEAILTALGIEIILGALCWCAWRLRVPEQLPVSIT